MNTISCRLCLITDPAYLPEDQFRDKIRAALDGGVDMIQYRNRSGTRDLKREQAEILREITRHYQAVFIINKDMNLALEVEADGVQLGKGSLPASETRQALGTERWIGVSVHNAAEITEAESQGADFLLLSPLFSPGSKAATLPPLGEKKFSSLIQTTSLPVFALGGVNPDNVPTAIQCGAHGVASISGILAAASILEAARKMREGIDKA